MENLIVVRQLPVIEERLRSLKEKTDKQVADALAMVCTEETILSVKATRTALNKTFQELEEQRKAVKAAVLDPYNQFEAVYRECVSDAFKRADAELKQKISEVETAMKKRCEDGLREYFDELCQAHRIDFLRYEQVGISVDMASAKAKTPKKLREQLVQFVASVSQSVELISSMEDADEIMVEYKHNLSLGNAVAIVQERHRRLEAERAAAARREEEKARQAEAVHRVQKCFTPPMVKEVPKEEEVFQRFTFTCINATKTQLIRVREFMNREGIQYE